MCREGAEQGMVAEHGNGMCGRREWEWQNREWLQNTEWKPTLTTLISSRDIN
jgi:hypothetical protein